MAAVQIPPCLPGSTSNSGGIAIISTFCGVFSAGFVDFLETNRTEEAPGLGRHELPSLFCVACHWRRFGRRRLLLQRFRLPLSGLAARTLLEAGSCCFPGPPLRQSRLAASGWNIASTWHTMQHCVPSISWPWCRSSSIALMPQRRDVRKLSRRVERQEHCNAGVNLVLRLRTSSTLSASAVLTSGCSDQNKLLSARLRCTVVRASPVHGVHHGFCALCPRPDTVLSILDVSDCVRGQSEVS